MAGFRDLATAPVGQNLQNQRGDGNDQSRNGDNGMGPHQIGPQSKRRQITGRQDWRQGQVA